MRKKQIYAPLNEDALLKSLGPFRLFITDKLGVGLNRGREAIYKPLVIDETRICGEVIIIGKKSKYLVPKK